MLGSRAMEFLRRRPRRALAIAGVALAVLAIGLFPLFAPKGSVSVDQPPPGAEFQEAKRGTFRDGAPGHAVSGTVTLLRGPEGDVLRFEDYRATAGPDVYFYLTPSADPRTTREVESGLRVLVPGGDEDGEATLRGNFNVPLPAGFDPAAFRGLAAWCDRFDVLFGSASLA